MKVKMFNVFLRFKVNTGEMIVDIYEHLTPEDMEARFLMLQDCSPAGKVIGHLCFAHASVAE
jgi:hypothetical protein